MFHKLSMTVVAWNERCYGFRTQHNLDKWICYPVILETDLCPSQQPKSSQGLAEHCCQTHFIVWLCQFGCFALLRERQEGRWMTPEDRASLVGLPQDIWKMLTETERRINWGFCKNIKHCIKSFWILFQICLVILCSVQKIYGQKCWYQVNHLCCYIVGNVFEKLKQAIHWESSKTYVSWKWYMIAVKLYKSFIGW